MTTSNRRFSRHARLGRGRRSLGLGFTLIELMVTIAIVAILTGIAIASYDFAVVKGRRSAAAGCLTERAQQMERVYTTEISYLDRTTGNPTPIVQCGTDVAPHYTLSYRDPQPTATEFLIQAVPQGGQATSDERCGTLTIDSTGNRGSIDGDGADTGNADDCW